MKHITLPRLRLNQLQSLCETALRVCNPLPGLEVPCEQLQQRYGQFKQSLEKSLVNSSREAFDVSRDRTISGFEFHVKALRYFPNNSEAVNSALAQLEQLLSQHDPDMRSLPFDEESAAIDNYVADLKKFDFSPLADTQLERWVSAIENENQAFKQASEAWANHKVELEKMASPSAIAPELRRLLSNLFTVLVAMRLIQSGDEALQNAYIAITEQINGFK